MIQVNSRGEEEGRGKERRSSLGKRGMMIKMEPTKPCGNSDHDQ